ncbi:MAG: glycoside hydrolase family 32 protein, partial [Candidatus Hydrogenedentes bacterium]|nr:glycoside hydrolase family 32 protein [Candidatus Hydrogenedentota bacterium]
APPVENTTGFRDPYVWEQDGVWYMALGTGIRDQGGAAFLYRSEDLVSWEYLHLLDSGFGNMWECPNFFPIEDKHVLVVAPYNILRYAVGSYKNDRFERETPWRLLCLSDNRGFYASHTQLDAQGRRIVWGWITGPGSTGHPWNGMIALPRVVTLSKDNRLSVAPLPELAQLRGGHVAFSDILIEKDSPYVLEGVSGDAIEIDLTFDIGASQSVGLDVLCSPDGEEKTRIVFDNYALTLAAGDQKGPFQLAPGETKMRLQVYVDRSVVEVFANGRENIICRTYPARTDSKQVRLFSSGDRSKVPQVDVWQLGSI